MKQAPTLPRSLVVLLGFLALSLLVSAIGGAITATSLDDWYPTLSKPSFNPPDWVFGPVWVTLFMMMGVAAWRVWRQAGWQSARGALILYFCQLVVNLLWSVTFFGLQQPAVALVVCIFLLALIAAAIRIFRRHDGWTALLLLPYFGWVGFACILNAAIVALN